jgi:hypothetical protein
MAPPAGPRTTARAASRTAAATQSLRLAPVRRRSAAPAAPAAAAARAAVTASARRRHDASVRARVAAPPRRHVAHLRVRRASTVLPCALPCGARRRRVAHARDLAARSRAGGGGDCCCASRSRRRATRGTRPRCSAACAPAAANGAARKSVATRRGKEQVLLCHYGAGRATTDTFPHLPALSLPQMPYVSAPPGARVPWLCKLGGANVCICVPSPCWLTSGAGAKACA